MTDHIRKAISNGEQIEEIIISAKTTAEVKFKGYSILCSNMAPKDLGNYVHNYFKFQLEKTDNHVIKQIKLTNNDLTKTDFNRYRKEVIESLNDLLGLPNNYSNKNKD